VDSSFKFYLSYFEGNQKRRLLIILLGIAFLSNLHPSQPVKETHKGALKFGNFPAEKATKK
jgi:hypothetical protein